MALCNRAIGLTDDLECNAYKKNEKCELGLALSANAPPEHADRYNANFARGKDGFPKVLFFLEPATRCGARMKWDEYLKKERKKGR